MTTRHGNTQAHRKLWLAAILSLALIGCGGGSDIASNEGGGIGGTGISFGVITGFGSVFVNGTRFATDDAVILIDGVPATEAELTEGMLVRIEGQWNSDGNGVAARIEYDDEIRGPVQEVAIDPLTGAGTLTVLGQTVQVDDRTVFRGVARDAIANGDFVRISGWSQGNGQYLASLVRRIGDFAEGDEVEIRGFIAGLDTTGRSFSIGGIPVNYDDATEIEMAGDRDEIIAGDEGEFVEVEGRFTGGTILADEIEREDGDNRFRAGTGDDIEFEGPVSSVDPVDRTFIVHGITVRVTNGTEFDDGLLESDLTPGLQVDIEGEWNADGEVVAEEIEPRSVDSEVEAAILQVIDPVDRLLDVGGVRVQVTDRTLITDDDDDDRVSFAQLFENDYVEVDGIRREEPGAGVFLEATRIERDDDDDDDFNLTARVDDVGTASFEILGVTINVDGATEWDDGLDGIDDLEPGMQVEVEYEQRGGVFYALEVEREDDDDDDDD